MRREVRSQQAIDGIERRVRRVRQRWCARCQISRRRLREADAGVPRQPLVDPGAKKTDLGARQPRPFLRHDFVRVDAGHHGDEMTLGALARHDRWTVLAALQKQLASLNAEAATAPAASMTTDATDLKNGFDVGDERNRAVCRRGQLPGGRRLSAQRSGTHHSSETRDQAQPDDPAPHGRERRKSRVVRQLVTAMPTDSGTFTRTGRQLDRQVRSTAVARKRVAAFHLMCSCARFPLLRAPARLHRVTRLPTTCGLAVSPCARARASIRADLSQQLQPVQHP